MKCRVCGFRDNAPDEKVCRQCGEVFSPQKGGASPIEGGPRSESVDQQTQLGYGIEDRELTRRTVIGRTEEESGYSTLPTEEHCSHCGYLLRQGQSICPNCSTVGAGQTATPKPPDSSRMGKTHTRRIENFTPATQGTTIRLEPVNGAHQPVIESRQIPLTLKRDDLDPQDDSISGSGHLSIFKQEGTGEWMLRNDASNHALFVQVENEVPIQSGAIVLIGQHKLYRLVIEE